MQESSFSLSGVQMTRNYVSAIIEGSGIYSYDTYSGQKQQIGVTNECYTQLQNTAREATDKAEEYYNKLVEVGVIVPPKTPEQTIAELTAMIGELRNEIREMKENKMEVTRNESPKYSESVGTKIDFYEYQNLRDQLAQERTKNVVLENRVYSDAKFNTLERQNEAMFGILKSEIAELSCNVPKRPPYFAQGYVACGTPIPAGCCN